MRAHKKSVPCNFVGQFNVGDNIVYNANILCSLVQKNRGSIFNKLIVVQIGSIIEASLAEIIYRAQNFNREGVPQISKDGQRAIAGKKVDKFNNIIDVLKSHSVLSALRSSVYDALHSLRKYRNKVHIQDPVKIDGCPNDEVDIFSDDLLVWSLNLNIEVFLFLSKEMKRPSHLNNYVGNISVSTAK